MLERGARARVRAHMCMCARVCVRVCTRAPAHKDAQCEKDVLRCECVFVTAYAMKRKQQPLPFG